MPSHYKHKSAMKRARPSPAGAPRKRFRSKYYKPAPRKGYRTVPRSTGVYGSGDMKYFDTEHSATAIPASADWTGTTFAPNVGTPTTMVNPVTGSGISNRIGREIVLYKLKIRGLINVPAQVNQTAGDGGSLIRMALVQDMQTNFTQAVGPDIFRAPTTASALMVPLSYQSLANFGKFKVLKDKTFKLQNPNISWDGTNMEQQGLDHHVKFNVRFPGGLKINFNATNGGTISDIINHSFCIYATCSSVALIPNFSYQARACFKEK